MEKNLKTYTKKSNLLLSLIPRVGYGYRQTKCFEIPNLLYLIKVVIIEKFKQLMFDMKLCHYGGLTDNISICIKKMTL